jgi:PHD/YefM family antitoxin component YafN of YafNO toxin-antitoxin module
MADTITLKKLYAELQDLKATVVRKEDLDALLETHAVLASPATMRQLAASRADKASGRTTLVQCARDLL